MALPGTGHAYFTEESKWVGQVAKLLTQAMDVNGPPTHTSRWNGERPARFRAGRSHLLFFPYGCITRRSVYTRSPAVMFT
ncbi:MAG TPA: hypothetical protein PLL25_13790, partial [Flavobacteriales bacterium]|nr:hypothetical protein [Flavobacteriales bacterium]